MRPIDADALKKQIEDFHCKGCDNYNFVRCRACWVDDTLSYLDDAPTVGEWNNVKDMLPVETHSIFWRFHGTEKWTSTMWMQQSDKVLVTVAFKDGTKIVTTGETHDGVWNTRISRALEPVVTHWQAMPEPPEEEEHAPNRC